MYMHPHLWAMPLGRSTIAKPASPTGCTAGQTPRRLGAATRRAKTCNDQALDKLSQESIKATTKP